jgi:hypothetical protein
MTTMQGQIATLGEKAPLAAKVDKAIAHFRTNAASDAYLS